MSLYKKYNGNSKKPMEMYELNELSTFKVDEGYYAVVEYGCGNVGFVITDDGIVVIDSNTTYEAAQNILQAIRSISDKPIKYLIYTHGHFDHVGGAKAFKDEGAKFIAHKNVSERFRRYTAFAEYHARINGIQANNDYLNTKEAWSNFVYPDIEYSGDEYQFELGGKTFRLIHGKGETDDATVVYIPEDRIVYSGDFIISMFPNIGNPNKVIRYEREWYEMLDRIAKFNPKAIVPGHGRVLTGDDLQNSLKDNSDALKYLYEKSVEYINKGFGLDDIIKEVQLPEHLQNSEYIKQQYGNREFTFRGIYRRYTGWYDGNPTNLNPSSKKDVSTAIYELVGDGEKILQKALSYKNDNNPQLALHVLDILLAGEPQNKSAHQLKGELLKKLAEAAENLFYNNFYFHGSNEEFRIADSI